MDKSIGLFYNIIIKGGVMETIQEQYNAVAKEMKAVQEQITELATSEQVKKYFELQKQKDSLQTQEKNLYRKLKINRYESCQHL